MRTLYVAWQDPVRRAWYPVGRLGFDDGYFRFAYLQGAEEARQRSGFSPLVALPELYETYESDQLFPVFANRIPGRSRPDYENYLEWLNLPRGQDDPIAILVGSGGQRATDSLEVFPSPEPVNGTYHAQFFSQGLRHLTADSAAKVSRLTAGERLFVVQASENPRALRSLALRTQDSAMVGWCPRYLVDDVTELLEKCATPPEVEVERLNPPPAPLQLRLLCSLTANWPEGFQPCSGPMYQPLVAETAPPQVAM